MTCYLFHQHQPSVTSFLCTAVLLLLQIFRWRALRTKEKQTNKFPLTKHFPVPSPPQIKPMINMPYNGSPSTPFTLPEEFSTLQYSLSGRSRDDKTFIYVSDNLSISPSCGARDSREAGRLFVRSFSPHSPEKPVTRATLATHSYLRKPSSYDQQKQRTQAKRLETAFQFWLDWYHACTASEALYPRYLQSLAWRNGTP